MHMKEYESPKFEFQEMKLTEQIADTCWGYKYGWYDIDGDGILDQGETIRLDWGSCNAVADGLVKYMKENFNMTIDRKAVHENSHSQLVRPIES